MSLRTRIRASDFATATLLLLLLSGCGSNGIGTIYPVQGQVLRDGEPIKARSGHVLLKPDTEQGNTTRFEPAGTIDADGGYVIYTQEYRGAPPGWYKVIVTASGDLEIPSKGKGTTRPLPKRLLPERYGQPQTTPLTIEVVASPSAGAYDLNVTD